MDRNVSKALGITVVALCLGGAAAWWVTRTRSTTDLTRANQTNFLTLTQQSSALSSRRNRTNRLAANNLDPAPGVVVDGLPWEEKLDQILLDEGSDENAKADQLLKMFPSLSEEAQLEVLQHVVNLVSDDHFEATGQILTNHLANEEVLSVLMTDLMNRTNTLKLPLLLELAKNEEHPLRQEAKDLLEFYVEEDHGTNWGLWEKGIQKWLKENESE